MPESQPKNQPAVKRRSRILLVDDDEGIRLALGRFLERRGYEVVAAGSMREALAAAAKGGDLALVDQVLPDGSGIDLLPRLRGTLPGIPIIVLTAHGTIDAAVRAIKDGADQFLIKPIDMEALVLLMERLLEDRRNRQNQLASRSRSTLPNPFLGRSAAMRRLAEEAEHVVESDRPVLILGETGTGKGVLARYLHGAGPRADEPFVDLNCAGLSRELLDAELFGHEAGAFTGAIKAKPGLLEVAHRGSVFLDEIGDMDLTIQPRILKVIEEKRFRRLGEVRDRHVDIRLMAATHRELAQLMAAGRFREDLYYRVSALELRLPPLRERAEDLPLLARELLDAFSRETGRGRIEVEEAALAVLAAQPWPGNLRELRNVLETAVLRSRSTTLRADDLRLRPIAGGEVSATPLRTLSEVERDHIRRVLSATDGHVVRAAALLGISSSSLYERLKRFEPAAGEIRGRSGGKDEPSDAG